MSKQVMAAAVLALALLLVLGCGDGTATPVTEVTKQVRGQILEVVGRNIAEVELLRIRDENGQIWSFVTEGPVGFTPSHLREHQLFGEPVLVSYVEKEDTLVAVDIRD